MINLRCKICEAATRLVFNTQVLKKYDVAYYQCESCGFLQTEPVYWLKEAYENSMNLTDTGIVVRNLRLVRISSTILFFFFGKKGKYLDYAGGFGLYTRWMRDVGFNFYWSDPFTSNLLARGFEAAEGDRFLLATSFESFEHFENPHEDLKKILHLSDNILLSTELLPSPTPPLSNWWYYAPEHGQHIAFYTKQSFSVLAKKYGLHYYNSDNIHLLTKKQLSLFGRVIFALPFSKYFFYVGSYFIAPFMKPKTWTDASELK